MTTRRLLPLLLILMPWVGFGQFQNVPPTQYPALEAILNAKPASQTGPLTPTSSCTPGKDYYTQTNGTFWTCTATNVWTATTTEFRSVDYVWPAQQPGGSLSSGSTNTVPLAPCPRGLGGYIYITGGTGTAEAVLVTGGTCPVGGAPSGTVSFTPTSNHSGAWTLQSATVGAQEALNSLPAASGLVRLPPTPVTLHGPVFVFKNTVVAGVALFSTNCLVAADFPLTASGIFIGPTNVDGQGPQITDLTITFIQPDSTNIATYTHWPVAINMLNVPRFRIANVQVVAAWDGVDMRENTGGAIINNLQISMFDQGVMIDGAFDSVYLDGVRCWPYGLTTNQSNITFTNSTTYCVNAGRVDDIHITNFFSDVTHGISLHAGVVVAGVPSGTLTNVVLDTNSDLSISGGAEIRIDGLALSFVPIGSVPAMTVSGTATQVQLVNAFFFPGPMVFGSQPWITVGSAALLQITNSWFLSNQFDMSSITMGSGTLIASNNWFQRDSNTTYSTPTISVTGGRATIVNNRALDTAIAGNVFVSITSDDFHQVRGNSVPGWASMFPATSGVGGIYESQGNGGAPDRLGPFYWGVGGPQGIVTAAPGSLYLNVSGGATLTLWIKESGTGNTGWVAK